MHTQLFFAIKQNKLKFYIIFLHGKLVAQLIDTRCTRAAVYQQPKQHLIVAYLNARF